MTAEPTDHLGIAAEFYIREKAFADFEGRREGDAHAAVLEAYQYANRAAAAQWRRLGQTQWRGLTRALALLGAAASKVGEAA